MTRKLGLKAGFVALVLSLFTFVGHFSNKVYAQNYGYNNSYQQFYNDLAPHGQWYQDPQYGYVWSPNVGSNFRPYYTNGYWAMTEYGNMWISNYSWGWAAFHYGRWIMSDYGWVWVPGNEWAPAWVTWRQGGGYYGWAPLGPGASFSMSFNNSYYLPDPYWTFIPYNYIYNRSFHRYYAPRRTRTVIYNTTIINNTYVDNRSRNTYAYGPRRSEIEQRTGRRVEQYEVTNRDRAGAPSIRNGSVDVYRPTIDNNTSRTAAPRNVKQLNESVGNRSSASPVQRNTNVTPVQRGDNTAPVQRNSNVSPTQRDNNTAPVQRSNNAAPVQRENKAAPVQRNNNVAPVQRGTNTAPVQRSNNVAPVKRETNPAPVTQQSVRNTQSQVSPRSTPATNRNETSRSRVNAAPVQKAQQQATRTVAPQREVRSQSPARSTENAPARSVQRR